MLGIIITAIIGAVCVVAASVMMFLKRKKAEELWGEATADMQGILDRVRGSVDGAIDNVKSVAENALDEIREELDELEEKADEVLEDGEIFAEDVTDEAKKELEEKAAWLQGVIDKLAEL